MAKKKILFAGASGTVADIVVPVLAATYDVVGISGSRESTRKYCVDWRSGDLLHKYEEIFSSVFKEHAFDGIIWNAVRYFPGPLLEASRPALHTEFDLAIALPLCCLRAAIATGFGEGSPFVLVSSQLAFGRSQGWGSYSIMKQGQIILASYLADEVPAGRVRLRIVAPGSVPNTSSSRLLDAFERALSTEDAPIVYKVEEG